MKKWLLFWISSVMLFSSCCFANLSASPLALLEQMQAAHQTQNYEMLYVLQEGEKLTSYRYRHFYQQQPYAYLERLDEDDEAIILRNHTVSYLRNGETFSLNAPQILDHLPTVLTSPLSQLTQYQFEIIGKARLADRTARIIQIKPTDHFRYEYTLWIDEETNLLLQSVLVDSSTETILEQFKVVELYQNDDIENDINALQQLNLPTTLTNSTQATASEKPSFWIPEGFKLKASTNVNTIAAESYLYSDGLSSFTLYFLPNTEKNNLSLFIPQGKISLFSQTIGQKELVIIGDIPLIAAKTISEKIAQSLPNQAQ